MACIKKSLAIRHFRPNYIENLPWASLVFDRQFKRKKSRNFTHPLVFNLKMNNEPLHDTQGQLRRLLSRLPDAPLASNFTAQVLQAIELEEMRRSRWHLLDWNWRVFFPRAAGLTVTVGLAVVVFHQHEMSVQRRQLASSVAIVAAQPMPSLDALKNFDAIRRMGQTARPDNELLALASDMK